MNRWIAIASTALLAAACASGRFGPPPSARVPDSPRTLKHLSVDERAATLQRARLWQEIDIRSLNLATGPRLPAAERIGANLPCRFVLPDKPLTGNTPKFLCAGKPDDVVMVKYGDDNGEVYAEVAASRLFWALGFKADRMYPVRVVCQGCSGDPFLASKAERHADPPGGTGQLVFDPATVERPFPGSPIEVAGFEGWAWPELEKVNSRQGGASRAQVDALKLLAVFVQHSDTKPEQQAMVCAPGRVKKDRAGNETCTLPWLVVKDLGATFGKATARNSSKMDLADWSSAGIWRDATACIGDLPRSLTGSLENPRISEAGRQFLARRLSMLSDRQIHDLFRAARAERRGGSLDQWVGVFKQKRNEIASQRCQD